MAQPLYSLYTLHVTIISLNFRQRIRPFVLDDVTWPTHTCDGKLVRKAGSILGPLAPQASVLPLDHYTTGYGMSMGTAMNLSVLYNFHTSHSVTLLYFTY